MAELNAAQVMALRKKTDAPMMECKQALTECNGDEEAAIEWLKKKHKGKMEVRADRETGEGRIGVYISDDGTTGGIIELRCETAPVAKNDMFVDLANDIARHVATGSEKAPDPEQIRSAVETRMTEVYGKLRETMNLGQCRKVTGDALASYVHHDGKSGVMIAMNGKPQDADLGRNLAMHAASIKPVAANREDVPAEQVNRVREEARAQAKAEGKPDQIIDKIAEGKVGAFYAQCVLMDQDHVRSDVYGNKAKVKDVLAKGGVTGVTEIVHMVVGG